MRLYLRRVERCLSSAHKGAFNKHKHNDIKDNDCYDSHLRKENFIYEKSRPAKQMKSDNARRLVFSLWCSGNGIYIYPRHTDMQLYMLCCFSPPRVKTGIAFFSISLDTTLDRKRQRAAVNRFIEAYLLSVDYVCARRYEA